MSYFSLLQTSWLPVRRRSGARAVIRPAEIGSTLDDPVVAFAWGRPDFDAASREFMIGLLATAFPAPATHRGWRKWWDAPPDAAQLDAAFAPFADAFVLDGAGPRFLQDFDGLEDAEESPVVALLIDAPGANAIKENKDLFQKRGQIDFLSRPAAAMALFALQTFAPAGGAGHRVSLRGGGPMTTLVAPTTDDALWRLLWLNTPPSDEEFEPPHEEKDRVFPWLAPTLVSDGKPERRVAPSNERAPWTAHSVQAFWGMPRRIRLVCKENEGRMRCPLTGVVDDVVVTGFRARPWGVSYDVSFRHPLSPYYAAKGKKDEPLSWLPVHPQPGGVPYKDWPSLTEAVADEAQPAMMTVAAQKRLAGLGEGEARLLACGYDMDNMKARGFVEAQMPLFILSEKASDKARMQLRDLVLRLVDAADLAASATGIAIRTALAGERANSRATPFAAVRERFFQNTEREFYDNLDALFHAVATLETFEARKAYTEAWLALLRKAAQSLFEEAVNFLDMPEKIMERAVPARRNLIGVFLGYGALGKKLFAALELAPPTPAKLRKTSGKTK